jgi:YegS/Rv2252/BmrU family lipid kinase
MKSSNGPGVQKKVLVIFNPAAGWRRRRKLNRFMSALRRRGCVIDLLETAAPGDATRFAARAAILDYDVIAVAGGDGTVNEVVNGLNGSDVPIAVVPLGTANVLAAEISLPRTMTGCAEVVFAGAPRRVYLGAFNGRLFVIMAGIGFDARVVADVTPALKRRFRKGAYVLKTALGAFRYPQTDYALVIDGTPHRATSAIIANGRHYGGDYICAPDASLDDPAFQVCLFHEAGWWHVLRYGVGLIRGRLYRYPDVEILRASRVEIEDGRGDPVQADGDLIGRLPGIAEITSKTLRLVCPA